jgi:hypothetical protein
MLDDFEALSIEGTLAFARLTILLLFLANLVVFWTGVGQETALHGMCAAIVCAGCSYVSQQSYTAARFGLGYAFQLLAIAAAVVSFWCLLAWAP